MRKRSAPWLVLLLWPLVSLANEVDIPELGIRMTILPEAATRPQVSARTGGHEATTHLGAATLSIYREDDPVSAGSDVADPNYRAILDGKFGGPVESKDQGAPTGVGGHSGWTVVDLREPNRSSQGGYTCITYVIVDQHLYRLTVSAGATDPRPPEFDALVRALSGITFEQVQRADRG
jgi:hypothetical protein